MIDFPIALRDVVLRDEDNSFYTLPLFVCVCTPLCMAFVCAAYQYNTPNTSVETAAQYCPRSTGKRLGGFRSATDETTGRSSIPLHAGSPTSRKRLVIVSAPTGPAVLPVDDSDESVIMQFMPAAPHPCASILATTTGLAYVVDQRCGAVCVSGAFARAREEGDGLD